MYTQVKNVRWANSDKSSIDCEVLFTHLSENEFVLFSANPNDIEDYGREIYQRCLNMEFGLIAEYKTPIYETNQNKLDSQPTVEGAQTL